MDVFREELADLKTARPTVLAFGRDAYNILNEHLRRDEYGRLIRLTHYSHHIGKEAYKQDVLRQIGDS